MIKSLILSACLVLGLATPTLSVSKDEITVRLNREGCFLFSQVIVEIGAEKLQGVPKEQQLQVLEGVQGLSNDVRALARHIIDLVYKTDAKTIEDFQVLGLAFDIRCVEQNGVVVFPRKTSV